MADKPTIEQLKPCPSCKGNGYSGGQVPEQEDLRGEYDFACEDCLGTGRNLASEQASALADESVSEKIAEARQQAARGNFYNAYGAMCDAMARLTALKTTDPQVAVLREALERIEQSDVGLQALDETYREKGLEVPWAERAKYLMRQVERRRDIARTALNETRHAD